MEKHQDTLNIKNACEFMDVSCSGFYASLNRAPSTHIIEDEVLSERIKSIFTEHKGRYGTRRIGRLLRKQGLYTKISTL